MPPNRYIDGSRILPQSIQPDRIVGLFVKPPGGATRPTRPGETPVTPMPELVFNVDLLLDQSISGIKIATNAIGHDHLIDGAVDAAKLAEGSVYADALQDGAVDLGSSVCTGNLAADRIAAGVLSAGVVYAGQIAAEQIHAGTINSDVIWGGTIGTDQLVAGSALIGDALIGSLSAEKITAGTIDVMVTLNAATVKTGTTGARVEMSDYAGNSFMKFYTGNEYSSPGAILMSYNEVTHFDEFALIGPGEGQAGVWLTDMFPTLGGEGRASLKAYGSGVTAGHHTVTIEALDTYDYNVPANLVQGVIDIIADSVNIEGTLYGDSAIFNDSVTVGGDLGVIGNITISSGASDDKLVFGSHSLIKYSNATGKLEIGRNAADTGWIGVKANIIDIASHVSLFDGTAYCQIYWDKATSSLKANHGGTVKTLAAW
jgi:hypothetical protein